MTITCDEFEVRLQSAIDERWPAEASACDALRLHAAACGECRRSWQEHVMLSRAIAEWRARVPETDVADRVLNRLRAERRQESSVSVQAPNAPRVVTILEEEPRRPQRGVLALAAACLAALAAVWAFSLPDAGREISVVPADPSASASTDPLGANHPTANHPTANHAAPNHAAPNQPGTTARSTAEAARPEESELAVSALVRDAGTAYRSLAGNAVASVRGAAPFVASESLSLLPPRTTAAPGVPASPRMPGMPSDRADGSPWQKNIGRALDLLWESLPADEAPAT